MGKYPVVILQSTLELAWPLCSPLTEIEAEVRRVHQRCCKEMEFWGDPSVTWQNLPVDEKLNAINWLKKNTAALFTNVAESTAQEVFHSKLKTVRRTFTEKRKTTSAPHRTKFWHKYCTVYRSDVPSGTQLS